MFARLKNELEDNKIAKVKIVMHRQKQNEIRNLFSVKLFVILEVIVPFRSKKNITAHFKRHNSYILQKL